MDAGASRAASSAAPPPAAAPSESPRLHALDPRRRADQASYSAEMPAYPARTLLLHCAMKGVEFSVLGLLLWPLAARRSGSFAASFRPVFLGLPCAGLVATALALAAKARNMDDAGVDDRAFRIARSASQNAVDREALIGAAVGAAAGAVLVGGGLSGVLATASLGVAAGVAYHAVEMEETKAGLAKVRELLK
jgi:hypothetical protein